MTAYFDFRTIDELLKEDCNFYRKQKEFTLDELSQYDGKNGRRAYVAIEGIVYDVSNELIFRKVKNIGVIAGKDLTELFDFYYRMNQIINKAPKIGIIDDNNDIECEISMVGYEKEKQDTSKFRHDDWSNHIDTLVKCAMSDSNKNGNKKKCKCQECIMSDALSGIENILQEALKKVVEWQTQLIMHPGPITGTTVTEGAGTTKGTVAKSSIEGPTDGIGIVGGAAGGAGGGIGGGIGGKSEDMENKSGGTGTKLGPGATGGATGGALGGSPRDVSPTGGGR